MFESKDLQKWARLGEDIEFNGLNEILMNMSKFLWDGTTKNLLAPLLRLLLNNDQRVVLSGELFTEQCVGVNDF